MTKNFFYEIFNYFFYTKNPLKILIPLIKKKRNFKIIKQLINRNKILKSKSYKFTKSDYDIKYIELNIFKKKIKFNLSNIWENNDNDQEIYFYKIRFNWLLFDNDHLSASDKFELINHFIINKNNKISDSYSIGERISNLIIFLNSNKLSIDSYKINNIKKYLEIEIINLVNEIEFHEEKTNNHIISNNKAIFFYSLYFNEIKFVDLCQKLFEFSCEHNFYTSGFSNEGSSQYHLLISKHIVEILYFNNLYKNNILNHKIITFFHKIISNCYIFTLSDYMPNIGDCTPDIPINYLRSIPYIANKLFNINYPLDFIATDNSCKIYASFFNLKDLKIPFLSNKNFKFYDQISGYLLISIDKVMFLSQFYNSNVIKSRTHQHTEFGNFILYYKNLPIIYDLGRGDYLSSSLASIGAEFHNSIMLNNLQPLICHKLTAIPDIMNDLYFQNSPDYKIIQNNNEYELEMIFYAYKRFKFKSVIKRKITLSKKYLKINDNISSNYEVDYKSFFHLNEDFLNKKIQNNKNFNNLGNNKYIFELLTENCNTEVNKNYYFSQYSLKEKCISLIVSKKLKKTDNINYILRFK